MIRSKHACMCAYGLTCSGLSSTSANSSSSLPSTVGGLFCSSRGTTRPSPSLSPLLARSWASRMSELCRNRSTLCCYEMMQGSLGRKFDHNKLSCAGKASKISDQVVYQENSLHCFMTTGATEKSLHSFCHCMSAQQVTTGLYRI